MSKLQDMLSKISNTDILNMSDNEVFNLFISISSLAIAIISLTIALLVLFYTTYQFVLKRGSRFYGMFTISSSVWSCQHYVSNVVIENTKDKAAAISTIYLRIGRNIYLELADYSSSPRILAPFETIKINFEEGVSGYITSTYKVDIDSILSDHNTPKNLIIATPQGISKVKKYKSHWNVYVESLKNHHIIPVHPVKKYHDGKNYSDALQFVVNITDFEDQLSKHYIYRNRTYLICGTELKTNDFSNAEDLKKYLIKKEKTHKTLTVDQVEYSYHDYNRYPKIKISQYGFFKTHIIGSISTKLSHLVFQYKTKNKK